MNNPFSTTIICWRTRNAKRHRRASELCRDYGFSPFLDACYWGQLRRSEERILFRNLLDVFVRNVEQFAVITLCRACYNGVHVHGMQKEPFGRKPFEVTGEPKR